MTEPGTLPEGVEQSERLLLNAYGRRCWSVGFAEGAAQERARQREAINDLHVIVEHLEEMAENARFARNLQLEGRRTRGLTPMAPESEADMPWIHLGVDHVDILVKAMRLLEAARTPPTPETR